MDEAYAQMPEEELEKFYNFFHKFLFFSFIIMLGLDYGM